MPGYNPGGSSGGGMVGGNLGGGMSFQGMPFSFGGSLATSGPSFMDNLKSLMPSAEGFAQFGQGAASLGGLYSGIKQTGLMEDQIENSLAFGNRNVANQATLTNQASMDRVHMAAQMNGHKPGTPGYDAYVAQNSAQVDGSRVA